VPLGSGSSVSAYRAAFGKHLGSNARGEGSRVENVERLSQVPIDIDR
jgi:hypothetical protein